ncbi:hypothetical protein WA026_008431 [Henosepilachna vigintioctopunctata]|uniref:Uncharacterized protein n=1 Tax=Henosepilachna vigintioctopunctata TaxID=420089 RepID=A0AAW1U880_9CUCU
MFAGAQMFDNGPAVNVPQAVGFSFVAMSSGQGFYRALEKWRISGLLPSLGRSPQAQYGYFDVSFDNINQWILSEVDFSRISKDMEDNTNIQKAGSE